MANAGAFKATACALRKRSAPTDIEWVKGHAGLAGNEAADALAGLGAEMPEEEGVDVPVADPQFTVSGAKLSTITQALAYRGIRATKRAPLRATTEHNLELTRNAARAHLTDRTHTNARIWLSIRKPDTTKKVGDFLWKVMHGAFKVGAYWSHIPDPTYADRAWCPVCANRPVESMEHILTECMAPERREVWRMCRKVWAKKWPTWPTLTVGTILGCGLAEFKDDEGRIHPGAARLFRILVSESSFLIWSLRCERRVGRQDEGPVATREQIRRRWLSRINDRLWVDAAMTHERFGRRALKPALVLKTWSGTLKGEHNLPEDWTKCPNLSVDST